MTWTRAQIAAEAAALDQGAAAKLAGAANADQAARDGSLDDLQHRQAAACSRVLREQAAEMTQLAAGLRDGYSPSELGYVGGPA